MSNKPKMNEIAVARDVSMAMVESMTSCFKKLLLLILFLGGLDICIGSPELEIGKVHCPENIDSLTFNYTRSQLNNKSKYDTMVIISLQLVFRNQRLVSWRNDTGNLMQSGMVSASGCGPRFPSGEVCSIGLWDERTNCLFSGITVSAYPSYAVYEFNNGYDYAFIFSRGNGNQELRQIMIYRPLIGSIYSKECKKSGGGFISSAEYVLDSVRINSYETALDFKKDNIAISKGIAILEKWMQKLKAKDFDRSISRILWEDIAK